MGDPKRRLDYSKRQKDWVVKNIYEKKDYTFRRKLLEAAEYRRRESNECLGDQVLPKPDLPPNIAPMPRPSKEAAFQRYQTRFEDN
ncbi:Hypp6121 [Branchiostoma lanceolatum]|uniref:Hypp6121 protein n=1 Tax=Branchiostoma lanceolatum TaxID=7740 RepID=A0A8J9WHX8_BRALA|nr:Hypp6121 [Branchiostoma lanceolatum]